jgi:hypothetical protein
MASLNQMILQMTQDIEVIPLYMIYSEQVTN